MATIALPIPATDAPITRGQVYQLTGLTASTRYKFLIQSTKCPKVTIAKEEALTTIQAQGYLSGTAFYFSTEAGQTSAYLLVEALEGAVISLTMAESVIPDPVVVQLPNTIEPEEWRHVTQLTAGTMYELKVSADVPVTVFSKTGTALASAIENPPLTTQAGSAYFVAAGDQVWLYVDGAVPANVNLAPFSGVASMPVFSTTAITTVDGMLELKGPLPAGYYAIDFVTRCDATLEADGTLHIMSQNVSYEAFAGVTNIDGVVLEPLFSTDGVVTGKNLRGRFIVSQDTPLGAGQVTEVALVSAPTGSDDSKFSGTATYSFVGNIA